MPTYVNIAAYKFVTLDDLARRQDDYRTVCRRLALRGTIIVSPEGVNLFLAGSRENIDSFLAHIRRDPDLADLEVKESFSDHQPFTRMLVKVKREIIAFGVDRIDPRRETSPRVSAEQLKCWLDEGRDVALLDVRNNFEYEVGTFDNAIPVGVDDFRNFSSVVDDLPEGLRHKCVVTFCTGGIRCEKAGPLLEREGFTDVYQLDGGILKYFEVVGGDHYHGDCFVFDKRVALDSDLNETDTEQCYLCQAILSLEDQRSPNYKPGVCCPRCYVSDEERREEQRRGHEEAIRRVTDPLPGSAPYDNIRPLHVPGKCDGQKAIDFLESWTLRVTRSEWEETCDAGMLVCEGKPVASGDVLRAGQRLLHTTPDTVEPDVNADIRIIHEDEDIIVIDKPAPLPMHPCGRFSRNTFSWILIKALDPVFPRPAHRLDANTSGVVIVSKTRAMAARVQSQFERGEVVKHYLARVAGQPTAREFTSTKSVENQRFRLGGRPVDPEGLSARTDFRVVTTYSDGSTLIEVRPRTGRTHQIRIHLWDMNLPILGDPLYLADRALGQSQTLAPSDAPMCLHAHRIEFDHPGTHERVTFESPIPEWASHA